MRLEREGRAVRVLEEGETFGITSLFGREAAFDVLVDEDLLAYRLPEIAFEKLLLDARFAAHFGASLADRLRATLDLSPVAAFQPDLSLTVRDLLRRPPVWVDEDADVGAAAALMRRERISSVLVRGMPVGILTDRDFRGRVLADGRGPDTPVRDVSSRPLRTVAANAPVYDAWATLLDAGVHHLPVVEGGAILGVITSTDLLRCTAQGPLAVLRGIERLASRQDLAGYAKRVAEMTAALLAGRLDAAVIAAFVAQLNDTLLRRILRWAEEDLGAPPAPYAWIVFGSEGRAEQTLLTDQDNALVYADGGEAHRAWFQAFAERANGDLVAAGFPPCPGGYMATKWQGTLSEWAARFRGWIEVPTPQSILVAAIFFDFRRVAGELDLAPLDAALTEAGRRPPFLRLMARAALEFRPPSGVGLRLKAAVDLKAHGISPVVYLGRCYGLEAGSRSPNTVHRLEAAVRAGLLQEEDVAGVVEAYRFLLGLRLRIQLGAGGETRETSSAVRLSSLRAVERSRLKDAFQAIRTLQERSAFKYQVPS